MLTPREWALCARNLPRAALEPGCGLVKPHAFESGESPHNKNLTTGAALRNRARSLTGTRGESVRPLSIHPQPNGRLFQRQIVFSAASPSPARPRPQRPARCPERGISS